MEKQFKQAESVRILAGIHDAYASHANISPTFCSRYCPSDERQCGIAGHVVGVRGDGLLY